VLDWFTSYCIVSIRSRSLVVSLYHLYIYVGIRASAASQLCDVAWFENRLLGEWVKSIE